MGKMSGIAQILFIRMGGSGLVTGFTFGILPMDIVTGEHAVHRFNKLGIYFALTNECA